MKNEQLTLDGIEPVTLTVDIETCGTSDDDIITVCVDESFSDVDYLSSFRDDMLDTLTIPAEMLVASEPSTAELTELRARMFWDKLNADEQARKEAVTVEYYYPESEGQVEETVALTEQDVMPKRMITIRHNADYNRDTVEVVDGKNPIGTYTFREIDPHKLAEIMTWFGYPVRVVDYMFEHDIAEFG